MGARSSSGAVVFLEVPYALPPGRFQDPVPLPADFVYEDKEYVAEATYAVQPLNDGQQGDTLFEDKVGFGKPSENALFLNIVVPPSFANATKLPVKVYIHGGFLQFGSPHSLSSQAQYISAERSEIWINIGYRLSVFGFLACDDPKIDGNFGFKDQWLALQWIKDNIDSFGGNPEDIEISGLSAGAHSVHQLLHHISLLPEGENSPFHTAVLQSNAIVSDPKTPLELRSQFQTLCSSLQIDQSSPDALQTLRDPSKIPAERIVAAVETSDLTFRGCSDGVFLPTNEMLRQRSGTFAKIVQAKGVKRILVGDLTEEWYIYSLSNPIQDSSDILFNLEKYYPTEIARALPKMYPPLSQNPTEEELKRRFGDILSDMQVHLPIRLLHHDLHEVGFPVLRYEIRWTPEQNRPKGYVTHGSDRYIWALRLPNLVEDEAEIARKWLDQIDEEKANLTHGKGRGSMKDILVLDTDKSIHWAKDERWDEMMRDRKSVV